MDKPKGGKEAVLKRIRERYDYGLKRMQYNLDQGDEDMKALSVDGNWPENEKRARKKAKRPMGHTDIISPNNDRVVNQFNMHSRGIKVVEKGQSATPETAALREARIREIEYENDAPAVYGTAIQNAVDRGWGAWKVSTEYKSPESFDLRICLERILNIKSLVFDPDTRKADRSDMNWLFHVDKEYIEEEFVAEFGEDAEFVSFTDEQRRMAPMWLGERKVRVAQYYEREKTKTRKLLLEGEAKPVLEMNLPEGAKVVKGKVNLVRYADGRERVIKRMDRCEVSKVMIYLTNGVDILGEPVPWVGSTIPFPICAGREKYEDDQLVIESMTRKMRHPSMMYDFADAGEREAMGFIMKAKMLTAEGQVEDFPEWEDPFRTNRVNLRYKSKVQGQEVPPPILIHSIPDLTPFQISKQSYLRAGQNAIGMSSTDQKDRISKSGVAQERIDQAGDIASFHYINSANRAIKYSNQIVNEILEKVEDTSQTVGVREADNTYRKEDLNVTEGPDGEVHHPYGHAEDHGFNIETGPGYQSQSDKADDFIATFIADDPMLKPRVADLAIKQARLGPLGDQMADRVKPKDIAEKEAREKQGQAEIPPELQQQITMMGEQMKQLVAVNKEQAQVIDAKLIESNAKKEIELGKAKISADLTKWSKYMDYKIAALKVNATAASDAEYIENEQKLAAEEDAHEFDMAQLAATRGLQADQAGREHEVNMTDMNQSHESEMAERAAAEQRAAQEAQMQQGAQ